MRNVLMYSVPHSGSSILAHMVHILGGQHYGNQEDDWHGWRRAEMTDVNELIGPAMRWHLGRPDVPAMSLPDIQIQLTRELRDLDPGWIVKTVHLLGAWEVLRESIRASGTDPVLVWVKRQREAVKESFASRVQYVRRGVPGSWGMDVDQMWTRAAECFKSWDGEKHILDLEKVTLAVEEKNGDKIHELFGFLAIVGDPVAAMNAFDPTRPTNRHHKHKGRSGWSATENQTTPDGKEVK